MRNFQSSEIVHAVRKLLTELETEYPDLSPNELQPLLAEAIGDVSDAVRAGNMPETAMRFALGEAVSAGKIPPWA